MTKPDCDGEVDARRGCPFLGSHSKPPVFKRAGASYLIVIAILIVIVFLTRLSPHDDDEDDDDEGQCGCLSGVLYRSQRHRTDVGPSHPHRHRFTGARVSIATCHGVVFDEAGLRWRSRWPSLILIPGPHPKPAVFKRAGASILIVIAIVIVIVFPTRLSPHDDDYDDEGQRGCLARALFRSHRP
ncbi:MAG: hypothetical protein GY906_29220 [bacterium]|nr:hypothetical protein [bacterium]